MPGFDPDEPRDPMGRWTATFGSATQNAASDRKNLLTNFFTPNTNLSEELKAVEQKFFNDLNENFNAKEQQYLSELSGENHNIVSNDNAKDLSPDYNKTKETRAELAAAVHEPASAFVKQVYADLLSRKPASNTVVFTAGGPGAGKTTGIENVDTLKQLSDKADIVFDSNLAETGGAIKKIDQALKSGRNVNIIFVHRDIEDAFKNGVIPRMIRQGRSIPIAEHMVKTPAGIHVMEGLEKHYNENKNVSFNYVDNSLGKGKAVKSTFETIKKKAYISDIPKVEKDLIDYARQLKQQGKITEGQFEGLTIKARNKD